MKIETFAVQGKHFEPALSSVIKEIVYFPPNDDFCEQGVKVTVIAGMKGAEGSIHGEGPLLAFVHGMKFHDPIQLDNGDYVSIIADSIGTWMIYGARRVEVR